MNADLYINSLFKRKSGTHVCLPVTQEHNIVIRKYKENTRWIMDVILFGVLSSEGIEAVTSLSTNSQMSDGVKLLDISECRMVFSFAPDTEEGVKETYKKFLEMLSLVMSDHKNYEDIIDIDTIS